MGADPIAMCGNCREVTSMFSLTSCVKCINDRFATDINEKIGRVVTEKHEKNGRKQFIAPYCSRDTICEELERVIQETKKGHRVLIDPCW